MLGHAEACKQVADQIAGEEAARTQQLKQEVKRRAALERQLMEEQEETRRFVQQSVMQENRKLADSRRDALKAQKAQEMEQDLANLELFNARWGSTPR